MHGLLQLSARDASGALRVVVETPRGSRTKLKYRAKDGVFELSRTLVLGLAYPYDWGFVPSTIAPDGDPLDAMIVHEAPTYPGVVIPCHPVATVFLSQAGCRGGPNGADRIRNDRVIAVPVSDRGGASDALSDGLRRELERFFVLATLDANKDVGIEGWGGPKEAEELVAQAEGAHRRRAAIRCGA